MALEFGIIFHLYCSYNLLNFQPHTDSAVVLSSLWHKDVPLKVVLFA